MEALREKNELGTKLTDCLEKLHVGTGMPTNAEEVINGIVETITAHFAKNGGNVEHPWPDIDQSFSSIQKLISDENACMGFLNQITGKLSEKINTSTEISEGESYLERCIRCLEEISHDIESAPMRSIEKVANAIDPKLPIERRYELAQQLKLGIAWVSSTGKLFISRRNSDEVPLLPGMVDGITPNTHINFHHADGAISMSATHGIILEKIIAIEQEKKLMDAIGYADKEEITRNRLVFGAKGANLLAIQKLLPKFEGTQFEYIARHISIPPFSLVNTNVYKQWENKEDISGSLRIIYEDHKGKPMMVRSSAVYSEDGDQMTGAGIYLSVPLEEDATFEQFLDAVVQVYESVDSDEAKKYRKENGVEEEFMGLVVQERIENPDLGYVNSTRPHTDDTTVMKMDNRRAPFIFDAHKFDHFTFLDEAGLRLLNASSRVQLETLFMDTDEFTVTNIVAFARFLEKHYGQPVQIEFSKESGWDRAAEFHFLQARALPAKMFEAHKLEFPTDVQPMYECPAEGVCDEVLDVLDVYQNNNDTKGFVVYVTSWEGSMQGNRLERAMPKEGAVMVLFDSDPGRGHIETLALERGVTLLFHDHLTMGKLQEGTADAAMAATRESIHQCLWRGVLGLSNNFAGHKKVRIIANGKIARIYPVKELSREQRC